MRLNYNNSGLALLTDNMQETLLKSECMVAENISEDQLNWHRLIKNKAVISELAAIEKFGLWGLEITEGVRKAQDVLRSRQSAYEWDIEKIEDVKNTPQYARALEMVKNRFSGPMSDGSALFPYQIETAAMMIAKKRLLLALDMGLGSVLCSVTN